MIDFIPPNFGFYLLLGFRMVLSASSDSHIYGLGRRKEVQSLFIVTLQSHEKRNYGTPSIGKLYRYVTLDTFIKRRKGAYRFSEVKLRRRPVSAIP